MNVAGPVDTIDVVRTDDETAGIGSTERESDEKPVHDVTMAVEEQPGMQTWDPTDTEDPGIPSDGGLGEDAGVTEDASGDRGRSPSDSTVTRVADVGTG